MQIQIQEYVSVVPTHVGEVESEDRRTPEVCQPTGVHSTLLLKRVYLKQGGNQYLILISSL